MIVGVGLVNGAYAAPVGGEFRNRLPQDEIIYFLLPDRFENGDSSNDRGGLAGGPLATGFDPTNAGFYHGGDLRGLLDRLDYIQGLGVTALWLAPVFKNKPVQGDPGEQSAGYHGYWILDFTHIDPHLGTDADFQTLVDAAHARGMKVYLDIVVNHTADVIAYRECPRNDCAYRSRADYPYTRRGGVGGESINEGFEGDGAAYQTAENFARLRRPDYAYTPYVVAGERHAKSPQWLNDPIYYHNRGNTTFQGESSLQGDFAGLDDLMTEHPRVVRGFIDIYGGWIDRFGIDGFRIDTAKHVNPEFWHHFVPAMRAHAMADGIPNFHLFGEVQAGADPAILARHTHLGLPAVLDFAFAHAVRDAVAGSAGTDRLADLFANDVLYEGGAAAALQLPTFISNHDDIGRFAFAVRNLRPDATEDEVLQRVILANAMLLTLRGVPAIYYGDEQGFAGAGGDRAVREDMFASRTAAYTAERLLGTTATLADSSFNTGHPLYRRIAELCRLRRENRALRQGRQVVRSASHAPGLFAVSRIDPVSGAELLIIFNTGSTTLDAQVEVDPYSQRFRPLHGACAATVSATGSYPAHVGALDYVVCAAERMP